VSSEYPTQEFIKAQIKAGKWPANEGEILDIRSLSDKEIKYIELYNQEEQIKQQRRTNALLGKIADALEGNLCANDVIDDLNTDSQDSLCERFSDALSKAADLIDDGKVNGSRGKKE
jgi:hypothetical protein